MCHYLRERVFIMLGFFILAHTDGLLSNPIGKMHHCMDKAADKIIELDVNQGYNCMGKLTDKLVIRAVTLSPSYTALLENATHWKYSGSTGKMETVDTITINLSRRETAVVGAAFAFLAGCTDVICLARHTAFGTMMTGNLLLLGRSIVENGWATAKGDIVPYPIYYAVIFACRAFGLILHRCVKQKSTVGAAVILGPILVVGMFIAELKFYMFDIRAVPVVWLVAFVYGVQRQVAWPALGMPTVMISGHVSNIVNTLLAVVLKEKPTKDLAKIITPMAISTSIFCGALVGTFANCYIRGPGQRTFLHTPITLLQAILWVFLERRLMLGPVCSSPRPLDGPTVVSWAP